MTKQKLTIIILVIVVALLLSACHAPCDVTTMRCAWV